MYVRMYALLRIQRACNRYAECIYAMIFSFYHLATYVLSDTRF